MRRLLKKTVWPWARWLALCGGLWTAPALAASADLACVPSDVPQQVVLTLARASGVLLHSAATDRNQLALTALLELAHRKLIGPGALAEIQGTLNERRMSADLYHRFLAEVSGDPSGATLSRRGTPLPTAACVTLQDLQRLMRGQRTTMQDPYLTPAAATGVRR